MDQLENLFLAFGIQAIGRLVEKDNLRVVDDRLGQLEPLLHPGRVGVDLPVALLAHANKIEQLMRPLPRGLERKPAQLRAIGHVLAADHAGDVAILFRRVAHPLADLAALAAHFATEQLGRAGADGLKLKQAFHEGALPAPLGPSSPIAPGATFKSTPSSARCLP